MGIKEQLESSTVTLEPGWIYGINRKNGNAYRWKIGRPAKQKNETN